MCCSMLRTGAGVGGIGPPGMEGVRGKGVLVGLYRAFVLLS